MTTQDWIDAALKGTAVWQIGQIDKPTERALNRLVAAGSLVKLRGSFMGISRLKTIWCKPDCRDFNNLEVLSLVRAA